MFNATVSASGCGPSATTQTAALGVAVHSAWVTVVALNGPWDTPTLIDRRRIELIPEGFPAQVYHAAAESGLSPGDGAALIERGRAAALANAQRGLADLAQVVRIAGYNPAVCGIGGTMKPLPTLETILRSHPLLHGAEGQLTRGVIADAARAAGLTPRYVPATTKPDPPTRSLIAALGRTAGPPWAADEKLAAFAALSALRTSLRASGGS